MPVIVVGTSRVHLPDTLASDPVEKDLAREAAAFVEAEAALRQAIDNAPDNVELLVDYARSAERRGDFAEAAVRWARLRQTAPHHSAGFVDGARALRQSGQFDDAETLLREAMERFPDDAGPVFEHAWLAHLRHDWVEAISRWEGVRLRFPDHPVGYPNGAVALREARRFDEAEQLLADAMTRFPNERAPFVEYAWLATVRRDWPTADERWGEVRRRYPELAEGYVRGAQARSEMWRYDEAEQILADGVAQFPHHDGLACEYAWGAFRRHDFEEAVRRFEGVRERFPDCLTGYTAGALALRNLFRLRDAELLLEEAQPRFPAEPRVLFEHAQLPMFHPLRRERDPDEALRRLSRLREAFPDFEQGYVQALRYLREGGRFDEADALAQSGLQRLPRSAAIAVEYGNNARERGDWDAAIQRFETAIDAFPDEPGGTIGLAASLSMAGRHDAAERRLSEAIERFPHNSVVFNEYAQVAARQERWAEALARWSEAQRRFPEQRDFERHIFEARLHLTEEDEGAAAGTQADGGAADADAAPDASSSEADPRAATRELVMQFESLGGRGLGCEFGMFQREFGAEPLGLLRWADMPYEGVISCLESRFEGVGSDEHTELFINRENSRPEYCTRDRRGFMFMRAFVYEDEMPFERMRQQVLRRLGYLKDKLIRDLEEGSKIFLYRITDRNLTADELARLHAAVRSYGDNMLLYVRYADAAHPSGTVELAAPGLMIGYMERFKVMPDGQLYASPPSDLWLEVCKNAHALSVSTAQPSTAASPANSDATAATRELMMAFESLGGSGHGCEFGIIQRHFGAEPLGLLRWADLAPHLLAAALEDEFNGVGQPENTILFVPETTGQPEYWTRDTRYWMAMRTFVSTGQIPEETMRERVCRRLQFLRRKLIEDLSAGDKIFAYKVLERNLTEAELARIHDAMRQYGSNTLLYARYADENHPNGTVEVAAPGLMIGYIDRFSNSAGHEYLGVASESWLTICRNAYALWRDGAAPA